jgi:hypothetical protein
MALKPSMSIRMLWRSTAGPSAAMCPGISAALTVGKSQIA